MLGVNFFCMSFQMSTHLCCSAAQVYQFSITDITEERILEEGLEGGGSNSLQTCKGTGERGQISNRFIHSSHH